MTITLEDPLWLDIFWKTNGTLVIILNGCGAWAIFKFSSQEMSTYKYFLLNILFWAFCLDLDLNWYFCPVALFPLPGGYASMTCGMAWTPQWMRWPTTVASLLILENCSVSLVISFLYRWWAIEPTVWFARTPKNMIGSCVFCHLVIIIPNAVLVSQASHPKEYQYEFVVKNYPNYTFMFNYTNWMVFPLEKSNLIVFVLWMWGFGIVLMLAVAGFGILQVLIALRKFSVPNTDESEQLQVTSTVLDLLDDTDMTYYMVAVFCMHSNVNVIVMITVTKPFRNGLLKRIPYLKRNFIEIQSVGNSHNTLSRALAEEASAY